MSTPVMYMIAGPNGAGKSTFYEQRLKKVIDAPFINADLIQRDELKDPSMQASYKAAEIAEGRRRDHLRAGKSFISESTFSHPSKLELIQEAKNAGFRVALYHVNVRNPELSIKRVAKRVGEGGHDVPEDKTRERYERNQPLIRQAILKADRAYVYDNSALNQVPARAIDFKHGQVVRVADNVPAWARELYAKELEAFSPARLNPAAASFADAKAIVARTAGPDAQLRVADPGKTDISEIVGETTLHWVQRTGPADHVAHFKSRLGPDVRMGSHQEISYSRAGGAKDQGMPEHPAAAGTAGAAASSETQLPMPPTVRPDVQAAIRAITALAPVAHPQRNPGPDRGR